MKPWTIQDKTSGRFVRQHERVDVVCGCGKKFVASVDRVSIGRGKYCSKSCMYKYRKPKQIKPTAKYSAIHKWIAKQYGQSMKCEWCGFTSDNPYQIQWANLDSEYTRDRDTWARLCAKCHWHYDREGL